MIKAKPTTPTPGKSTRKKPTSKLVRELWARAAGRCQFPTCNRILYESKDTRESINSGQIAHIHPVSQKATRGRCRSIDDNDSINLISNQMLLCYDCHKKIDQNEVGEKYTVKKLKLWKHEHEARIKIVTGIRNNMDSHMVIYTSKIDDNSHGREKNNMGVAMLKRGYYPAESEIDLSSFQAASRDGSEDFWNTEDAHLNKLYQQRIVPIIENPNHAPHFSLFAVAPMPLLIRLGTLFSEKNHVDVYQCLRNPKGWIWQDYPKNFKYIIKKPRFKNDESPTLVISISARVKMDDVRDIIGSNVPVWELTVPEKYRHLDTIRHHKQLDDMRIATRSLLSKIREEHGDKPLSIFPAMPASCAIEFGRTKMSKIEMPWVIYDLNKEFGGFVETIRIHEVDAD